MGNNSAPTRCDSMHRVAPALVPHCRGLLRCRHSDAWTSRGRLGPGPSLGRAHAADFSMCVRLGLPVASRMSENMPTRPRAPRSAAAGDPRGARPRGAGACPLERTAREPEGAPWAFGARRSPRHSICTLRLGQSSWPLARPPPRAPGRPPTPRNTTMDPRRFRPLVLALSLLCALPSEAFAQDRERPGRPSQGSGGSGRPAPSPSPSG